LLFIIDLLINIQELL